MRLLGCRLRTVLAALVRLAREASGDLAYEAYLARVHAEPRLTRAQFWLDTLCRRYSGPSRCC